MGLPTDVHKRLEPNFAPSAFCPEAAEHAARMAIHQRQPDARPAPRGTREYVEAALAPVTLPNLTGDATIVALADLTPAYIMLQVRHYGRCNTTGKDQWHYGRLWGLPRDS